MAQSTFPLLFLITKRPEPGMKMKCFETERRKQLIMALFQKIIFISVCTVVTCLDTHYAMYTHVCTHTRTHTHITHTKIALHSKHINHLPSTGGFFLHKTACPSELFTFSRQPLFTCSSEKSSPLACITTDGKYHFPSPPLPSPLCDKSLQVLNSHILEYSGGIPRFISAPTLCSVFI